MDEPAGRTLVLVRHAKSSWDLDVEDVACAVVYMAGLPLSANVQSMTVMATTMPFIGRG